MTKRNQGTQCDTQADGINPYAADENERPTLTFIDTALLEELTARSRPTPPRATKLPGRHRRA